MKWRVQPTARAATEEHSSGEDGAGKMRAGAATRRGRALVHRLCATPRRAHARVIKTTPETTMPAMAPPSHPKMYRCVWQVPQLLQNGVETVRIHVDAQSASLLH